MILELGSSGKRMLLCKGEKLKCCRGVSQRDQYSLSCVDQVAKYQTAWALLFCPRIIIIMG